MPKNPVRKTTPEQNRKYAENRRKFLILKSYEANKEVYGEVQEFLFRVKRAGFFIEQVDFFILIDLFDRVYPTIENIPHCTRPLRSVNIMFYKLVNWWRVLNDKKPLPKADFTKIK